MTLSPLTTQILAALAARDNTSAGIWDQMTEDSGVDFMLQNRAYYYALDRLCRDGLVDKTGGSSGHAHYHLTPQGRRLLGFESARVSTLARLLRARLG